MTWRIIWTGPAARDMRRLDSEVARRARLALIRLAEGDSRNLKRLRGVGEEWRLRVGDYRARVSLDPAAQAIIIYRVLHRREVYR